VGAVPFPIPFSGTLETVPRLTAHAHRDSLCASDRDPVPASRRRINTAFPHVRSWKVRKRTLPHSTVSASSPTNVPTGWAVLLALLAGWGITLRLGLLLVIPLAAVIVIVVLVVIYPGSLVATAVLTGGAGGGYHGIRRLVRAHCGYMVSLPESRVSVSSRQRRRRSGWGGPRSFSCRVFHLDPHPELARRRARRRDRISARPATGQTPRVCQWRAITTGQQRYV
jgi:hypothetical protein